jgi:signal transduction histidine kinase
VRQVYEIAAERGGVQGHITSLRPLRPENRPDAWERSALERLERGEEQVDSVVTFRGEPYLRHMRPYLMEAACLKCHAAQGYEIGDVRGGITISVPLAPYQAIQQRQALPLGAAHLGLWLLGAIGIIAVDRRVRQRTMEREREEQERRSLEQQLHHARRIDSVGRLTGGIAHDLNNLLAPILGFSSIVLEEMAPRDPLRSDVEEIRRAAERARDLTHRLLAFSRKQELKVEPLDVGDLVAGMRKMLASVLGEDVRLLVELPAGLPPVRADRAQLELVLLNLAINARDAMPHGGALSIAAGEQRLAEPSKALDLPPGHFVAVTVADTGTGMDEETLERVFEPFFTTKAPGKGTGLGLPSVHGIVKQHGGALEVTSEPGRGTAVRLLFPAAATPASRPAEPAPKPPRGSERVLVVEDDPAVLRFVSRTLASLGYEVTEAAGPVEALGAAEAGGARPEILVTDVIMPDMSGPELARRLSGVWPGLAALFISGNPRDALGPGTPGAGPLWKPFTPLELANAVRRAIDAARAQRVGPDRSGAVNESEAAAGGGRPC